MEKNIYQKNITLLYVYSVLIKRVSMPIIVLYYLFNNLTFAEIGILTSVGIGVSLLLDIQGGIFADTHGRKNSFIMHSVFGFLTALFLFLGNSFEWFLVAGVMFGISSAFFTGTMNSFLYDTLILLGRSNEFKKYKGKIILIPHLINAVILLGIPIVYEYNHKLPFLIVMIFYTLSIVVAAFFVEPEVKKKTDKKFHLYGAHFVESLKEISLKNELKYIIIFTGFISAFLFASMDFTQPLLKISGLEVIYFGFFYAILRVMRGFGAAISHRLEKRFSLKKLLLFGMILISLMFFGIAFGWGMMIILALLIRGLVTGMTAVFFSDEINKRINSQNRTTILSIASFFKSILQIIFALVFSAFADFVGVQEMFVVVFVSLIIFFATVIITKNRVSKAFC